MDRVVLVRIEHGGRQKATNESLRLVGGLLAGVEGRGKWKSTNESQLVGGGLGRRRGSFWSELRLAFVVDEGWTPSNKL